MLTDWQWKLCRDDRAALMGGTNDEISTGDHHPFPHVGKPHAVRSHFSCLEAQAVILDGEDDVVILPAQVHPDMACIGMFYNVVERFLENAIQCNVIDIR